jgi:hypothetical protein
MNKMKLIAAALALVGMSGMAAHASILVNEPFATDGGLVGTNPTVGGPWAAHSGAGSVPVQVSSGAAIIAQGAGSREDVNVAFAGGETAGAGEKFYASFDLTIADPAAAVTSGYFAHFLQGTSSFTTRVWVAPGTTSANFKLAISGGSTIESTWASDLSYGTTYKVVMLYDYDNALTTGAKLWVNPVNESSTSISSTTGFQNAIFALAFRQAAGNTSQTIDNVLVGTTFTDVVPEPTGLAVLGIGAAVGLLARRRGSR